MTIFSANKEKETNEALEVLNRGAAELLLLRSSLDCVIILYTDNTTPTALSSSRLRIHGRECYTQRDAKVNKIK